MPDPEDGQEGNAIIGLFLRSSGTEREGLLGAIQKRLPSWIRVYDVNSSLHVYCDAVATPLPPWLTHPANYVERVFADGSAEVLKGGFGPTKLNRTTEVRPKSAWEILLEDDDL